jgi:hypothetical protein
MQCPEVQAVVGDVIEVVRGVRQNLDLDSGYGSEAHSGMEVLANCYAVQLIRVRAGCTVWTANNKATFTLGHGGENDAINVREGSRGCFPKGGKSQSPCNYQSVPEQGSSIERNHALFLLW